MSIRKMVIDDYEAVYALWLSCKGMGLNGTNDSREGIARFLARNPDTCFVATQDDAIVGSIMAGNDGRRGFIYHTAVSPAHRRKGIGGHLVQAALAALQADGITKVALVVFDRNEEGNAFWERQGFTLRTDIFYRNREIVSTQRLDT